MDSAERERGKGGWRGGGREGGRRGRRGTEREKRERSVVEMREIGLKQVNEPEHFFGWPERNEMK